ncbi:MAG: prolyl oligopeptidase family serine peptidase, partial [Verrucomicrobiota bacterium]
MPPSMGCDEVVVGGLTGALGVVISAPSTVVVTQMNLSFTGWAEGLHGSNLWSFGDGVEATNRIDVQPAWSTPGDYDVVLRIFNQTHPAGVAATVAVRVVTIGEATIYADASNSLPAAPYTNWSGAAATLQEAVDVAAQSGIVGIRVLVTNGVYDTGGAVTPGFSCSNRVAITDPVPVFSVNGPDVTIIQGAPGVRGVYMTAGLLSGFTITNGQTLTSGDLDNDRSGGGAHLRAGSGRLEDCVLIGNTASSDGGGAYGGVLQRCRVAGNTAQRGGGMLETEARNCLIEGNTAFVGGGAVAGELVESTIVGNHANFLGGAVTSGSVRNSIVQDNTTPFPDGDFFQSSVAFCATPSLQPGPGNIVGPALFVNPGAGDYRLQFASPCINRGQNGSVSDLLDLAGNPRIVDGIVDMGAYEAYDDGRDSDGDMLSDWQEIRVHGSDMNQPDTDGDWMTDGEEVFAGTDPTDPQSLLAITSIIPGATNVGASYGGYAALMATVKTPDLFKCAVSFAGVSSLKHVIIHSRRFLNNEFVKNQIG